jgi:hypothetical protein
LRRVLSIQALDQLRSAPCLHTSARSTFRRILREKIFPPEFYERFDAAVSPHIGKDNDWYLFTDILHPHERLIEMFGAFTSAIQRPYSGRNFLELGVGAGGVSFTARALGFDVVATDAGQGKFPRSGEVARELLSIRPIDFLLTPGNSLAPLMQFRNGQKADYIYMDGVMFNHFYINGQIVTIPDKPFPDCWKWYGQDEWIIVLEDIFAQLNPGGCFINNNVFVLPESLASDLKNVMAGKYGKACRMEFTYSENPCFQPPVPMTNMRMTRVAE